MKKNGTNEYMGNRARVVGDFVSLVSREIEHAVERNVNIKELQQYKNILLIRSVKNDVFNRALIMLAEVITDIKLNVFGNEPDNEIREKLKEAPFQVKYQIYKYEGRITVNRLSEYKIAIENDNELDAILFLGYSPHSENYLNIENAAAYFADDTKLPVYAIMASGELCRYIDIRNHINAMNLYVSVVKWFHLS